MNLLASHKAEWDLSEYTRNSKIIKQLLNHLIADRRHKKWRQYGRSWYGPYLLRFHHQFVEKMKTANFILARSR